VKPADAARAVVIISARTLHGGDLTIVTYQDLQNVQHPPGWSMSPPNTRPRCGLRSGGSGMAFSVGDRTEEIAILADGRRPTMSIV